MKSILMAMAGVALLVGASEASAQGGTITQNQARPGGPPGQPGQNGALYFSGTSTAPSNYLNSQVTVAIGNYQFMPNGQGGFTQVFMPEPGTQTFYFYPQSPSTSVGNFSGTFTGLTSGKSYVIRASGTYQPYPIGSGNSVTHHADVTRVAP